MSHLIDKDFTDIALQFSNFFQNSSLTSSYKPILFKSIIYHLKTLHYEEKNKFNYIDISNISDFFVKVYFTLYRHFRLVQLTNRHKTIAIYALIDQYCNENENNKFPRLKDEEYKKMIFDIKRILFRNVIFLLRNDLHIYDFADDHKNILNLKRNFENEQDFKSTLRLQKISITDIKYLAIPKKVESFIGIQRSQIESALVARLALFLEVLNNVPNLNKKILVAFMEDYNHDRIISEEKKEELYNYQEYRCFYCGDIIKNTTENNMEADHFIPYSFLFDSEMWNIVGSCRKCNRHKSNKIADRKYLDKLIKRNQDIEFWKSLNNLKNFRDKEIPEKINISNSLLKQHYENALLYFKPITKNEIIKN